MRAERTRKEWTGRIVRDQSWEPRQPQDLVRGVIDDQSVPEARPRQTDVFLDVDTTLTAQANPGDTGIQVGSILNFNNGDQISVVTDGDGTLVTTVSGSPSGSTITLAAKIPAKASVGNQVRNWSTRPASQNAANFPAGA